MKKYVPFEKQSKKKQEEYNKKSRTVSGFNTGTRIFKTDKHPSRARRKILQGSDSFVNRKY